MGLFTGTRPQVTGNIPLVPPPYSFVPLNHPLRKNLTILLGTTFPRLLQLFQVYWLGPHKIPRCRCGQLSLQLMNETLTRISVNLNVYPYDEYDLLWTITVYFKVEWLSNGSLVANLGDTSTFPSRPSFMGTLKGVKLPSSSTSSFLRHIRITCWMMMMTTLRLRFTQTT